MHFFLKTGLALAAFAVAAGPAAAGPIQYVLSGPVTGKLNGVAFTDAQITFTAIGDTTGINTAIFGPGTPTNDVGNPTFTLAGFGSGTLTDDYVIFDNLGAVPLVGLDDNTNPANIFVETGPAFATYGLDTSLGPIAASSSTFDNPGRSFDTTLGTSILNGFGPSETFTATTSPVPEASTTVSFGLLLALGLGGVVIATKRKKATA